MECSNVEEQFIALIKKIEGMKDIENLELQSSISQYLNSITFIKFLISIEETFNIEFEDQELSMSNFNNFDDIITIIKNKIS